MLLWTLWIFIWVAALMVWIRCIFDLFGDTSLSGWAKAGWAVLLVLLPWVGAVIYLIARGRSMNERQRAKAEELEAAQADYIKKVAGGPAAPASPADQIASAKALLDAGTIDQGEFDALKAKALA
ncbi:PLDc N-terminal domain-containing protein [Nocardioides sp. NPDC006273]|uniref:SHOCT domain-containing protein n=1 Tax=Nocardioides sp. NPDC006273 TaxID=3155598 RepID=UPI0033B159C4